MTIPSAVLAAVLAQTPVAVPGQSPATLPIQTPPQPGSVPLQTPAVVPLPSHAGQQPKRPASAPPQGQQPAKPMPFGPQRGESMNNLQGFNIVLLVGESQSSGPSIEDVPAAARKALTDMRDFLPFKNYRVLDSQWTSCCANPRGTWISGRLQGVTAAQLANQMQLVPRSYTFKLLAETAVGESRLNVSFTLTPEQMGSRAEQSPISTAREAELEKRLAELRRELDTLEDEIPRRSTTQTAANSTEVVTLQTQRRRVQQRIAETTREIANLRARGPEVDRSNRNLIDGSFGMDVGETVVVGTSRLGGDKALIAIVTAARKSAR